MVELDRLLERKGTHRASRLFNQPSAIAICRGYSKRAKSQRQRGIQEETNHVYSNTTSNDSLIFLRSVLPPSSFETGVVSFRTSALMQRS